MHSHISNPVSRMECGRSEALRTHFLSELTPLEIGTLQKISIKRLKGLNLGNVSLPKPAPPPKPGPNFRRVSLRKTTANVSQVFGRPLHKVACAPVDLALLEQPIKLRDWLLSEKQPMANDSLTDSDSPPPFVRSAPLRRSCPNRSRPTRQTLESSLSITDLQADQPGPHSDRVAWLPCFALEAARHISQCGLRSEGIFRKSGSHQRMRQLREQWETGCLPGVPWRAGHYRFSYELHRPHDVAGLLKELLRELPQPLLTRELRPAFLKLYGSQPISWLLLLLPLKHRHLLQLMLCLCQLILLNSSENKMDALSLATVLAPGILPNPANEREDTLASVAVVRQLIDNFPQLLTVPASDFQLAQTVSVLQLTDSIPGVKRHTVASRLCDSARLEIPPNPQRHFTSSCRAPGRYTPELRPEQSRYTPEGSRYSQVEQYRAELGRQTPEIGRISPEPLGQRVKKFFKRALHSPVDSPTLAPKFNTCHSLSAHSHENLTTHRQTGSPQPDKKRPAARNPSENALRPKQQFVIRPIKSQDLADVGPAPKVLSQISYNARPFQGGNLIGQFSNNRTHFLAPSHKQLHNLTAD